MRTPLYETADSTLTRYRGAPALKTWALAIAKRSGRKKARIALARRLAVIMHAVIVDGSEFHNA